MNRLIGGSWLRWIGRAVYLVAIAVGSIMLLTAAQIAHAYLTAAGSGSSISAVAIRDTAGKFSANRAAHQEALDQVSIQQSRRVGALSMNGDAALYQYFHKVQFRRLIFGCYPNQYTRVRNQLPKTAGEKSSDELSWGSLLEVYIAARQAKVDGGEACTLALRDNSSAIARLKSSQFEWDDLFADCQKSSKTAEQLECLWDNVTLAVSLGELADARRSTFDQELQAARASASNFDAELATYEGLSEPSGRAAVAAWLSLDQPTVRSAGVGDDSAQARPPGLLQSIWEAPFKFIAWVATLPVLAQSALMAMLAGALGGGVARMWELLGYRRKEPVEIREAARDAAKTVQRLDAELDKTSADQGELARVRSELEEFRQTLTAATDALSAAHIEQSTDGNAPIIIATFSGAVAALILWLLTTSGLFVLSGGENTSSASPNVLLAISLIAGLASKRVIDVIFSFAEGTLSRLTPPQT